MVAGARPAETTGQELASTAGQARVGMEGRAEMGAGAGQGRGGTHNRDRGDVRVPTLKVCRNRLECSFRAVCRGKKPVFFTRFFLGGFLPCLTGF